MYSLIIVCLCVCMYSLICVYGYTHTHIRTQMNVEWCICISRDKKKTAKQASEERTHKKLLLNLDLRVVGQVANFLNDFSAIFLVLMGQTICIWFSQKLGKVNVCWTWAWLSWRQPQHQDIACGPQKIKFPLNIHFESPIMIRI